MEFDWFVRKEEILTSQGHNKIIHDQHDALKHERRGKRQSIPYGVPFFPKREPRLANGHCDLGNEGCWFLH